MRHATFALFTALALTLSAPSPVRAADAPNPHREEAERLLEDATRKVMRAFELMLMAIPQYAAPEILENGDIIIRRIHPKAEKDQSPPPAAPGDSTKI